MTNPGCRNWRRCRLPNYTWLFLYFDYCIKETAGPTVQNKGTPPIGTPHIIYRNFSKHHPFRNFRFSCKEFFKTTTPWRGRYLLFGVVISTYHRCGWGSSERTASLMCARADWPLAIWHAILSLHYPTHILYVHKLCSDRYTTQHILIFGFGL